MRVVVDLPAVRPGRFARTLADADLDEHVRDFRVYLRGARCEPLPEGVGLDVRLDVGALAALADVVRAEADALPFFSFRLLAEPPACRLEVTGTGPAAEMARAIFGGLAI